MRGIKRKVQTEERQFLYHQDSRINLNRRTLQHCPANSTNGLFQRRKTCTHTPSSNQRRGSLSFTSLARSPELSKNTKQACSNSCLCRLSPAHTQATVGCAGWRRQGYRSRVSPKLEAKCGFSKADLLNVTTSPLTYWSKWWKSDGHQHQNNSSRQCLSD